MSENAPFTPVVKDAIPPVIRPDLRESLRLPPPASDPSPPPIKPAPKLPGPKKAGFRKGIPKADAASGITIGAAFLTNLATFLNTFFTPLKKPPKLQNSARPVSGLMLLSSLPTIYLSGSKPRSFIWSKRSFFSLGFSSRTSIGRTVSPFPAWIT